MTTFNFNNITPQLTFLSAEMDKAITWFAKNPDYSDEGKRNHLKRVADQHGYTAALSKLRKAAAALPEAVAKEQAGEYAKVYPKAKDSTETLAAEMATQRYLQREDLTKTDGDNNNLAALQAVFKEMGPSPARTMLFEEMQARGITNAELMRGCEAEENPALRNAQYTANAAETTARLVNEQLDDLETSLQNPRMSTAGDTMKLDQIKNYLVNYFSDDMETDSHITFEKLRPAPAFNTPAPTE